MGERKVSVWLVGKDGVSAVLQATRKGIAAWAGHVTKIAAGIGLADGFKQIGSFIRDSVKQAADAYPKLGAGLTRVNAAFTEFRVQAGAAFLQVLQPALPLFERAFGWATKLAVQLPDAFDGGRIVLAQFVGFMRELPAIGQQAFGALARSAAEFVEKAGFVLSLFGSDAGIGAADRLNAFAAEQQQAGIIAQRNAKTRTDATVSGIAGTVRSPGQRVLSSRRTPATVGAEDETSAAERRAAEEALRADAARRARPGGIQFQGPDLSNVESVLTELPAATTAMEDFSAAGQNMRQIMIGASEATLLVGESLQAINGSLLGSIPGFGMVSKAATKAVGIIAQVEGTVAVAKGAVKIAESIFPFNPAGIASGTQMIATGKRLAALGGGGAGGGGGGGGGGGSGARGGGGGLSPENSGRDRQEATAGRAGTQVVTLQRGYVRTDDPDFQDFIRDLNRGGEGRDVVFRYTG